MLKSLFSAVLVLSASVSVYAQSLIAPGDRWVMTLGHERKVANLTEPHLEIEAHKMVDVAGTRAMTMLIYLKHGDGRKLIANEVLKETPKQQGTHVGILKDQQFYTLFDFSQEEGKATSVNRKNQEVYQLSRFGKNYFHFNLGSVTMAKLLKLNAMTKFIPSFSIGADAEFVNNQQDILVTFGGKFRARFSKVTTPAAVGGTASVASVKNSLAQPLKVVVNPVKADLTLIGEANLLHATVYNATGQALPVSVDLANKTLGTAKLVPGFYTAVVESNAGLQQLKFVKE